MPEPMNVTRWGVRAVDADLVRIYINGLLFDFDPHNATDLAQTIRVILGTDDAPSGADSPANGKTPANPHPSEGQATTEAHDG